MICPNCGAQYEVPTEVVPEAGRDVQCSNCGHTWFQRHPDQDRELTEELNQPLPDTEWRPDDASSALADEEAASPPMPGSEADQEPVPPRPEQSARSIDPSMAEMFREERDFEASQRAADALESQPDLGLQEPNEDELARRSREARERMALMRGDDPLSSEDAPKGTTPGSAPEQGGDGRDYAVAQAAAAAAAGSRRDLLPDVEEINQTLRSSSEPRALDADIEDGPALARTAPKGGFRKGFWTVFVLAGLALALYAYAPQIAELLPQSGPALEAYVAAVDSGRSWLDGQITTLLTMLDGMSSEAPSTPPAEN